MANELTGKRYWRSLDELAGTPEFREWLHREFPEGASELTSPHSRRSLLKLMAASFGLAGVISCRRPEERILPLAKRPEDYIPGNPLYYATAMTLGGLATGLIVEAHDGRPTKIEGNPKHPASLGAASALAQASILNLYDPDRSQRVLENGSPSSWERFAEAIPNLFAAPGEGVWVLSEPSSSPSFAAVREHFLERFPRARWVDYDPLGRTAELEGARIAFGRRLQPHYDFSKAEVILALDCDFLGVDAPSLRAVRQFAKGRHVENEHDSMNRLYVAESAFSITGAMADHRFRIKPSEAAALALALAGKGNGAPYWLDILRRDLEGHRGRSLVVAGPRQPAAVHALVWLINAELGNLGETVWFTEPPLPPSPQSIGDLAAALEAGEIKTLLILGGNPAFDAPADAELAARLEKAGTVIHLGPEVNETARAARWHLPEAHYLEAWGDARALDGTASVQQPLIRPLYEGKTAAETLALVSGYPQQRGYDIVRTYWMERFSGDRELAWRRALHDGVIEGTAFPRAGVTLRREAVEAEAVKLAASLEAKSGLEVAFYPSASVWDGRFANNGWLQEMPDPMTKLVWDNAALLSPATARELGVETGDVLRLEHEGRSIEVPAYVMPGQADGAVALELGYGRRSVGRVGRGVGHDVYPLRSAATMGYAVGVSASPAGRRYKLVTTQDHHVMEGRPLVREATIERYRAEPDFVDHAVHVPELGSLYDNPELTGEYQWGMAIDLNACTGCNACLVACQAENNIAIVGKDEVARGREMHWIRLDRYFTGEAEDPQAVFQPVACQQCEHAPCENVCPVVATTHTPEGLNDMVYNRCVGTRYCSNNCPYKVRRFNFLDWHGEVPGVKKLVFNPDVTVRMRGVMEKCTYCVQRIQEKKIQAKAEGRRKIQDGEIVTACQQTCPAEAIVFGNIADPNSRVSQVKKRNRDYAMLAELNVKPRTSYLAKLRNPNPELALAGQDGGGHASTHGPAPPGASPFRILNSAEGA